MTRSLIVERSSSATAARTVKIIFPVGVLVSIDSLQSYEVNTYRRELFQRSEQMRRRTREPVEAPYGNYIELSALGISHEPI